MTRKSVLPQPLKISESGTSYNQVPLESPSSTPSPISPSAKISGTRSPFKFNSKKAQIQAQTTKQSEPSSKPIVDTQPNTSPLQSPQTIASTSIFTFSLADLEKSERRERPTRSSFFNNYKASRSLNRLQADSSKKSIIPTSSMPKDTEKTGPGYSNSSHKEQLPTDPNLADLSLELRSDSPPPTASSNASKKSKQKAFNILSRSHSSRDEYGVSETLSETTLESEKSTSQSETTLPAAVDQERSYRSLITSNVRQHSSERMPSFHRDRSKEHKNRNAKDSSNAKSQIMLNMQKEQNRNPASYSTPSGGNNFLNNLKSQATKGAGALSKGLFGKGPRTGVSIEKSLEVDDENYELKVLNLPLIQQTRLTRISKKLEDSRDKTEFWMPAFPWRAIDYLNYKGSDVEGLYRVPGSGPEIKKWRRRFDQELDLDLFEQDDLYDINIIGSMLKAWLRELPDELLSKAAQERIARECATAEKVPQLLIDELSNLSPFNYYLLFAITCHLSLLLLHSEKNKMDYRNLCICFQPCMKIDALCFRFLVCDWRDCWKGCKTEPFYIEQEYILFDQAQSICPPLGSRCSTPKELSHEEYDWNLSGSESVKSSGANGEQSKLRNKSNQSSSQNHQSSRVNNTIQTTGHDKKDKGSARIVSHSSPHTSPKVQPVGSRSSISINPAVPNQHGEQRTQHIKKTDDIRPLSPIKPLSPMGF